MQLRVGIWVVDLAELSKSWSCTALQLLYWYVRIINMQSLCGFMALFSRLSYLVKLRYDSN